MTQQAKLKAVINALIEKDSTTAASEFRSYVTERIRASFDKQSANTISKEAK